jgi:uroporphyrinogen-III decarboxylase
MTETMTTWVNPDLTKSGEQLFAERNQRVLDAFAMRVPDRIPINVGVSYLVAEMGGVSHAEMYRDTALCARLTVEAAKRFGPDNLLGPWHDPRPSLALGDRMTKWPGYQLPDSSSYQFDEHEFMKAADYPAFLEDHSDWAIRTYLPRAFSELAGLALLPPLGASLFGYYNIFNMPVLTAPPVQQAFAAINNAAAAQVAWIGEQVALNQQLADVGVPPIAWLASIIEAPFDFMSDTLRGMRGIFLDLRQRPDDLLAAEQKVLKFQVELAISTSKALGVPYTFIPLHRGSDGFMSIPQFERFYWPQLKDMILQLVDAGVTPVVYYEGVWDQRLEYLAQLPKGKTVGYFQSSDIFKVKEIAGEVMCIAGGMSNSLLRSGPASAIRELTHELCERAGKGGGFVMNTGVMELEGCDPDLVEVWVNATKEFGVYPTPG